MVRGSSTFPMLSHIKFTKSNTHYDKGTALSEIKQAQLKLP